MFRRIESKVLALFVSGVVLWVVLLGFVFYFVAARTLESQVDTSLKTTATILASQWDGSLLRLLQPGMEQAPLYRTFGERLRLLLERAQVAGIYIATPNRTHIVSTRGGSQIGQALPRLDLLQTQVAEALAGRVAASPLVEVDGRMYKSALAPIYAGDQVAAVLMVDMSPWYLGYLRSFRNTLLLFTGAAIVVCVLSARRFYRSITLPLSRMVESVDEIGKARFEKKLAVTGTDELTRLADSIESMRLNILHREAQMKMMLSGIAHEIRNPLGGIELFTGILQKENLTEDQLAYVLKIKNEVGNLKKLLNEFLDFAKPRRLDYEKLNVGEVMSELQTVTREEFREKELRVSLDIQEGEDAVEADRARLRQALMNLYRNAFQADPQGGEVRYAEGVATILTDDATVLVTPTARVPEGNGNGWVAYHYDLTLSAPLGFPVSFSFATADGTAVVWKLRADTDPIW